MSKSFPSDDMSEGLFLSGPGPTHFAVLGIAGETNIHNLKR